MHARPIGRAVEPAGILPLAVDRGVTRRCAWLLITCSLAAGASARAQTTAVSGPSLSWVRLPGAEACIAQAELASRIETRLGRQVFVRPSDAILLVEGRVAPASTGGFAAVITLSDRAGHGFGERALSLASADCRQLDDVVALVIAVTLRGGPSGVPLPPEIASELEALFGDEPSVVESGDTGAANAPAPAPPATVTPVRDRQERVPAQSDPTPADEQLSLGLDLGMAVATGLQPAGTLAPGARAQVAVPGLATLALAGGIVLPQQLGVDDVSGGADGTLELRAFYVAFALCTTTARAFDTTLDVCARFGIGRLNANASGFMRDSELTQWWTELGPELALFAPLVPPLRARLGVSLPIRLSRPELVYLRRDGVRERAFQVAGIGLAGELALGVTLP